MKKQKFEVRRTKEGTFFEIAFLVLAIAVWVVIIQMMNHAPDTIPTHFGFSGAPDSYGDKHHLLFPCIMCTVIGFCCLMGAYFPHTVNIPWTKINNVRQATLAVRMMRITALLMLLLPVGITFDSIRGHILFSLLAIVALVIVCLIFSILIYKAK